MSARLSASLILTLSLAPASSRADDHWANVMASATTGSFISGAHAAIAVPIKCAHDDEAANCWNVLADVSVQKWGELEQVITTGGGVRYEFGRWGRHLFFAQALLAASHKQMTEKDKDMKEIDNDWRDGVAVGFGLELFTDRPELNRGHWDFAVRGQVDRIHPFGGQTYRPSYWRVSAGVSLRLLKEEKSGTSTSQSASAARRLTLPANAP